MDRRLGIVPLEAADNERVYGGKAVSLGAAIRAGLPVPGGAAIDVRAVDRIASGDRETIAALQGSSYVPATRLAVRSSAVGEDSADASFAGQHATRLNVRTAQVHDAVRFVWESGRTESALAYRRRKGLAMEPRLGVVVQMLIEPLAAGVLFTRHPVTGADQRMIEATWGLGEAVVNGAVVPDRFTLDHAGRVIERVAGDKDIKVWYGEGEGTIEMPVAPELRATPCLEDADLAALHELAERCRGVYGPDLDIEWAIAPDRSVHLLQARPITTFA